MIGSRDIIDVRNKYCNMLSKHSKSTYEHSVRVSLVALWIGSKWKLKSEEMFLLREASLLHDVGKLEVSNYILSKKGDLTEKEWEEMRRHTTVIKYILNRKEQLIIKGCLDGIIYHHERWDGRGYPYGLKGNKIPLQSRIIALADAIDAMSYGRSYKKPMKRDDVLFEVGINGGTQFDPGLVEYICYVKKLG